MLQQDKCNQGHQADPVSSFRALKSLTLISPSALRKIDTEALACISSGSSPSERLQKLLDDLKCLDKETLIQYAQYLSNFPLVGLHILCSSFSAERDRIPLSLSEAVKSLHYLGLTAKAQELLWNSSITLKDRSVFSQLISLYLDTCSYEEAKKAIQDSPFNPDIKVALHNRVAIAKARETFLDAHRKDSKWPVYVVNLPQDKYRGISVRARAAQLGLPINVVKATRIDDIPKPYSVLLRPPAREAVDGSFGNQISQYRIWKKIANTDSEYGIVMEDDAFVRYRGIDMLDFSSICGDFDILFINDRLCVERELAHGSAPLCLPLDLALMQLTSKTPELNAFGSDGYILSRRGARMLVDVANEEGFHTIGTDWYLISHSFDYHKLGEISKNSTTAKVLESRLGRISALQRYQSLKGLVFPFPLVEHRPLGVWRDSRVMS